MTVEPTHVLRDATAGDAESIAEVYDEAARSGSALMGDEPRTAAGVRQLFESFGRRETILILEGGYQIVGWGAVRRYGDHDAYRFSCETSVYLTQELAGKGYGTYLKRALIERCRDYGYRHLVTRIPSSLQRSIDDSLRLGYEMVGVQKQVAYLGERFRDVAILQLVLADVAPKIPEKYL